MSTAGEAPFRVAIVDAEDAPLYHRISPDAKHLQQLGMSSAAIARPLGADGKKGSPKLSALLLALAAAGRSEGG